MHTLGQRVELSVRVCRRVAGSNGTHAFECIATPCFGARWYETVLLRAAEGRRRYHTPPRHVKGGDVVRVVGTVAQGAVPERASMVVDAEDFWVEEPWERFTEALGGGGSDAAPQEAPTRNTAFRHSAAARGVVKGKVRWAVPCASFTGIPPPPPQHLKEAASPPPPPGPRPVSSRRPVALLQCNTSQAQRVAGLLHGEVATGYNKHMRLVYVYADDGRGGANAAWQGFAAAAVAGTLPQHLHGVVQRVFFVTAPPVVALAEAAAALRGAHIALGGGTPSAAPPDPLPVDEADAHRTRRLQAHPKELEVKVKDVMARFRRGDACDAPPGFTPRRPAAVGDAWDGAVPSSEGAQYDSVCFADGVYWLGLSTPRAIIPEERPAAPCGAYWKLREVEQRWLPQLYPDGHPFANRGVAIDVGASPGGWSYCLAKNFGTKTVLAVDPAAHYDAMVRPFLTPEDDFDALCGRLAAGEAGDAPPRIVPMLLRGEAALGEHILKRKVPVSIYVCDMNTRMEDTLALVESIHDAALFAAPALVVVTLKNNCKTPKEFAERAAACKARLAPWAAQVTETHLFANTTLETTLIATVE